MSPRERSPKIEGAEGRMATVRPRLLPVPRNPDGRGPSRPGRRGLEPRIDTDAHGSRTAPARPVAGRMASRDGAGRLGSRTGRIIGPRSDLRPSPRFSAWTGEVEVARIARRSG